MKSQTQTGVAAGLVVAALIVGYVAGIFFPIPIAQNIDKSTLSGSNACGKWKDTALVLKRPFKKEGSHAFVTTLSEFKHPGDTIEEKQRSRLVLCEDGQAIGTPHSEHDDVRTSGGGRYSHWIDSLYFSTPDNSDPNANGRMYTVVVPSDPVIGIGNH
jgi:hypothetical protein